MKMKVKSNKRRGEKKNGVCGFVCECDCDCDCE